MKGMTVLLAAIWLSLAGMAIASEDTLSFKDFGTVHLYQPTQAPASVAIFVSGDGGWNQAMVTNARSLAGLDALVIGVDIVPYLKTLDESREACVYPAADFESLSQYVQKKLELPGYIPPILVGYSSGATLVYALLVQAPPNTFSGAISLGFCPDLPVHRPFCKGRGLASEKIPKERGYQFLPARSVSNPWIVVQGQNDHRCDAKAAAQYVKRVAGARLVDLPRADQDFSIEQTYQSLVDSLKLGEQTAETHQPSQLADLPLVEVVPKSDTGALLACIVTGDGGWASIDRDIGNALAVHGIPVVGLNSLKYFWQRRTPDEAGQDLARILRTYLKKWKKDQILLVGYSRGADVLPFMTNRLPPELLKRVRLVALLGPSSAVDFQLHLVDFLGDRSRSTDLPILPEVEKLTGTPLACFYGSDEKESLCRKLDSAAVTIIQVQGGHHFGGDYEYLAEQILKLIK